MLVLVGVDVVADNTIIIIVIIVVVIIVIDLHCH